MQINKNIETTLNRNFNPLSPKGDQHQISLCNINALLYRAVMRTTDTITQDEFAWYFISFSPQLL